MSNAVFLRPDENGNWGKVGADASGNMSSLLTFQSGATGTGNGTAQDVSGYATLILQVTISATATVAFEGSLDGTNYASISTNSPNATGASQNSTNAAGISFWRLPVSGFKFFRARISVWTSGTVDVTGYASTAVYAPQYLTSQFGSTDANSATSILQGVGAYNLLFDGTNWARQRSVTGDGSAGIGLPSSGLYGYNGATWDRLRVIPASSGLIVSIRDVSGNNIQTVNAGQIVTTIRNSSGQEANVSSYGGSDGQASPNGMLATGAYSLAYNGTTWDRVRSVNTGQLKTTLYNSSGNELAFLNIATVPDAYNFSTTGIPTVNGAMGFTGTTWDRVRVGKVYKYIEYLNLANATATTVWTPASTKKFRLMGVSISCGSTGNKFHLRAGTAGSGTAFHTFRSTGSAGDTHSFYFGNGYLATNANDVLEIYNATGATADVWVTAWGTEE